MARINRDRLAERLVAAETSIADRAASAQRLARDGASDAELDTAEAALRASRERRDTLSAALVDLNQQVVTLESERDDLADKKLRTETAAAIEVMADEMTKAGAAFDAGATALVETSRRVATIVLDGHGLQAFAMNARAEVPAAVTMIAGILRDRARATLAGTAPAALPKAEPAPTPAQPPTRPKTEQLFLMRHVKWTDHTGQLQLGPQFSDAELPPAAAARALKSGAGIAMDDPRRKKLHCTKPPRQPNVEWCEDLDSKEEQHEPLRHSAFEPVDRGKPFMVKVSREAAS